ncbi:MAG TPA: MFS transporter [Acidimicrobiia bacterium]|nr:MFS transporter [Acidimicrobiia bacterium]
MARSLLVRLDAPSATVASRLGDLGAMAQPDGSWWFPLPVTADGASGVRVTLADEGAHRVLSARPRIAAHVPFFAWAMGPLLYLAAKRRARWVIASLAAADAGTAAPSRPRPVLGLPHVPFDALQIRMLATAAAATATASFGAALFGQHGQNVADAFGASDAALGNAFAVSRLGVLVALVATALSDRRGRRRLVVIAVAGIALANLASAFAPNLVVFTTLQMFVRGFVNTAAVVAGIAAIEEAPEGARAYAASMLGLAGGFGYSFAIITLPFGDLGADAWRIPFLLSGATVLLVAALARQLPESSRYERLAAVELPRGRLRAVFRGRYGRRFALLGAVAYLTNVFSAPSAQLANKYLADVHDFSDTKIALFRTITLGVPGLVGLVIGGRLAESRGRRPVAAGFLVVATIVEMAFFLGTGAVLWLSSSVAIVAASASGIALGTLSPELFPTEVRGTSNAFLLVLGVLGSVTGLVLAGNLSDPLGGLGRSIALCGVAAIVAAVVFVPRLPESRGHDLDDVSPSGAPTT